MICTAINQRTVCFKSDSKKTPRTLGHRLAREGAKGPLALPPAGDGGPGLKVPAPCGGRQWCLSPFHSIELQEIEDTHTNTQSRILVFIKGVDVNINISVRDEVRESDSRHNVSKNLVFQSKKNI